MRTALALLLTGLVVSLTPAVRADGPRDNLPDNVRRIPKEGIDVPEAERRALEAGLDALERAIEPIRARREPQLVEMLPDVLVLHKAVHDALTYGEFFAPGEIAKARSLLDLGRERAETLAAGAAPWAEEAGLVVRGYVSRIDSSVQPYGLVVPESYEPGGTGRYRLDVWFHGRGETLSEVNFLDERRTRPGTFTPEDTIVLHPYGRYSNAFKFAGEVDVLEAIESVRRRYRIDDDRISVRGFSMGGAACWQFAVHYPDRWFAANPGAGFAESARFLKVFQNEKLAPSWYEQKLWRLYDCTDVAANLLHCPTVAYSGELDAQKQAADVMAEALRPSGVELTHIIGPGTKHAYHPEARDEVERRMDLLARKGRETDPAEVSLVTYTLKYNRMHWLTVDALGEHWTRATAKARVEPREDGTTIAVAAENVTALTLDVPPGSSLLGRSGRPVVAIDGQSLEGPPLGSDRSWRLSLHREGDRWRLGPLTGDGPGKRHDLQGPIDDAFMDSFLMVRPTGRARHEAVGAWVEAEQAHAIEHWRRHFRGEARVKDDKDVTDDDIASSNLVLWGDPRSNALLARIADRLPIRWEADAIRVGDRSFPAEHHAPILIAPNPLNPGRYVVLNSGFTFREYDYLNNARQTPKLPDWAVVDVRTPPDARFPGKVVAADFFGEDWSVRPARGE